MQKEAMEERARQLREMIAAAEQEIKKAPEGEILCIQDKNKIRWYQVKERKRCYIKKKNRKLAEDLAIKKYREYQVIEWQQELSLLNKEVAMEKKRNTVTLLNNPMMADLLSGYMGEGWRWANESYPSNPLYPERKIHYTLGGVQVRSKSEWMICSIYEKYKIPFRYECAVDIGGHTFYPDFMIKHPKTGKIYIHEHFGIMDDPDYRENAIEKVRLYNSNGWLIMQNLIITSESLSMPIDIRQIEQMIYGIFVASEAQMDLTSAY